MRNEWIWLDMDGTIADLYGVEGWLDDLIAYRTRPYELAKDMYRLNDLLNVLIALKEEGYNLGVISWGSKANNKVFDEQVAKVKREWLENRLLDVILDEIIVTPYGVCKADTCKKFGCGILVDDEEQNRNAWYLGNTINANKNIIEELKKLLDNQQKINYNKYIN